MLGEWKKRQIGWEDRLYSHMKLQRAVGLVKIATDNNS